MANPKFLVLGANSFSGATFVDYLAEQGHDVTATSRTPDRPVPQLPYRWRKKPVRFEKVDLNHDLDGLDALLKRERYTHVVNFAAQSMVGQSWDHPDDWMHDQRGRDGAALRHADAASISSTATST